MALLYASSSAAVAAEVIMSLMSLFAPDVAFHNYASGLCKEV